MKACFSMQLNTCLYRKNHCLHLIHVLVVLVIVCCPAIFFYQSMLKQRSSIKATMSWSWIRNSKMKILILCIEMLVWSQIFIYFLFLLWLNLVRVKIMTNLVIISWQNAFCSIATFKCIIKFIICSWISFKAICQVKDKWYEMYSLILISSKIRVYLASFWQVHSIYKLKLMNIITMN